MPKERFKTGAVRDRRKGKGRFDLISPVFLKSLADVNEEGSYKYGANNWRKGIPPLRIFDSLLRHLIQWRLGLRDEDHLAHAGWNMMALYETVKRIENGELSNNLYDD